MERRCCGEGHGHLGIKCGILVPEGQFHAHCYYCGWRAETPLPEKEADAAAMAHWDACLGDVIAKATVMPDRLLQ